MKEDNLSPYMGKEEAARFLKMSVSGLNQLISKKRIPFIKATKIVLFNQESLEAWLKSHEVQPKTQPVKAALPLSSGSGIVRRG